MLAHAPSRAPRANVTASTPHSAAAVRVTEDISFGTFDVPLGTVLLGVTSRGIRFLAIGDSPEVLERDFRLALPWAALSHTLVVPTAWREEIERRLVGEAPRVELPLHTEGTPFQESVWAALRRIPHGEIRSYQQIAESIAHPTAARAVAQACAHNEIAVLVPCHRVVRGDGTVGGYRWGIERKLALLNAERGR